MAFASDTLWLQSSHNKLRATNTVHLEALGAESWTTGTITTKMGNMHKLKNAAGRKAAAAIQAAPDA